MAMNPPAPELCVAIDRESGGQIAYSDVNDKWLARNGPSDGRKRIPMDWDYVEAKAKAAPSTTAPAKEVP